METEQVAPAVGVAGSLALVLSVLAPLALVSDQTGLSAYYTAGPAGPAAIAFLALLEVVVLLAGRRGRTDPATAAGIAFVVGLSMLGIGTLWAISVDPNLIFSFPATDAWIEYHRWLVLALGGVVFASASAYARSVVA
jgi:hypothetical protein